MKTDEAELYFGRTHRIVGFTSSDVAQFDGSAEPIVRELIQNSLDAAYQAGQRVARVHFAITQATREQIPGWSKYTATFKTVVQQRTKNADSEPSHDEQMVIKRIEDTSNLKKISVLFCIDNGHGLNGKRMDALLTPGNTSKGAGGAGSFGLGHHAAFGASDLRYVMYGAKYADETGEINHIASGHAILATHSESMQSGERVIRAADGYWVKTGQGQLIFDGTGSHYPNSLPELLDRYLKRRSANKKTGTVVCISGFNDFRREDNEPTSVEAICRVAASNFSDAIHSGKLEITIKDDRDGTTSSVTKTTLEQILTEYSNNIRAAKAGQMNGRIAYNAWSTIKLGEKIICNGSSTIRWRLLDTSTGERTRIHVFRKGMWITSHAPTLEARSFSTCWPFDAVLSLEEGPLEKLVRSAEGPEHRGIDMKRLDSKQRRAYRELISDIVTELSSAVGERHDLDEFVPEGFATLTGHELISAERVRKPRIPAGGGSAKEEIQGGDQRRNGKGKRERHRNTPRSGSRPQYRAALKVIGPSTIKAYVDYEEELGSATDLGIRILVASGSDGTCDHPLSDHWLYILNVEDDKGNHIGSDDSQGALELLLPAVEGRRVLTVSLSAPIMDAKLLELNLVKRKRSLPLDSGASATSSAS